METRMDMKKKNVFALLGLSLALGIGVGAGVLNSKAPSAVEAATEETTFYVDCNATLNGLWKWDGSSINGVGIHLWGGSWSTPEGKDWAAGEAYIYNGDGNWSTITVSDVTYISFSISNWASATGMQIYYDSGSLGNYSDDISFSSFAAGQNLITLANSGSWNSKHSVTLGTLSIGTTYTVTKYGIWDGDTNSKYQIGSEVVSKGDTYAYPARINSSNYHFGGWYTDINCTTPYVGAPINADLDLYAKYTAFSKGSYIYYVTGSPDATPNMIHTWGGDVEYADKNVYITGIAGVEEVHGVVNFQGTRQMIYKIPFSSESGDTSFKFHDDNNWTNESPVKTLAAGHAYKWEADAEFDEAAAGEALDFILELETARKAVAAGGNIKAESVCGLTGTVATNLCTKYNLLSPDARTDYVDKSVVWTYEDADSVESDKNISIYDIMAQIAKQAGGVALNGHTAGIVDTLNRSNDNAAFAIAAISGAVLVTFAAGFFLLRRKHQN